MDAGDIYTAGLHYDEIPFITEMYDLPEPEYYVVAVAKEEDPSTELTYLKGFFSNSFKFNLNKYNIVVCVINFRKNDMPPRYIFWWWMDNTNGIFVE